MKTNDACTKLCPDRMTLGTPGDGYFMDHCQTINCIAWIDTTKILKSSCEELGYCTKYTDGVNKI